MPTLADLRVRFSSSSRSPLLSADVDEVLVADVRSKLSPAQIVEQKLRRALRARPDGAGELVADRRKRLND